MSSASFFQRAPIYSNFGENLIQVSNSLEPDETPSYSMSHLDPSYSHILSKTCKDDYSMRGVNRNALVLVLISAQMFMEPSSEEPGRLVDTRYEQNVVTSFRFNKNVSYYTFCLGTNNTIIIKKITRK